MNAVKKDFSPEQLKDLLWEIEQSPPLNNRMAAEDSCAVLAQNLGEELEEITVFGDDMPEPVYDRSPMENIAPAKTSLEEWLQEIAKQKIDEAISGKDLETAIGQILRQIVPPMAENLLTKEIERIKRQISGL